MILKSGGSAVLAAQGGGPAQASSAGLEELRAEIDTWKKKCKVFQQNEIKYIEELEALKA
jgi:hypothetical protein